MDFQKKFTNLRGSIYQKRRKMCASVDALGTSSIRTHVSTPITAVASVKPMRNQGIQANHFKYEKKRDKTIEATIQKRPVLSACKVEKPPPIPPLASIMDGEVSDTEIELNAGDGVKLAMLANIIRHHNKDFVKLNTLAVYKEKTRPLKLDPTRAPPTYRKGVVPKYLEEVKKKIRLNENKADGDKDPLCPPGHVRLSDEERKEHLSKIKESYSELVSKLNLLPMSSDSLRVRQRRAEMEKELDRLEAGIKIFSKDKLYVKLAS